MDVKAFAPYRFSGADTLITPQLVFYRDTIESNLDEIIRIAGGPDRLWPHVKSHKMIDCVRLQMKRGIRRFKCATIAEAEMLGMAGVSDALLAYPLVGPNIERFLTLIRMYPDTTFWAIGDSSTCAEELSAAACREGAAVHFLMDIDMGMHRTGVALCDAESLYRHWASLPGLKLLGFHCYDGNRHEPEAGTRLERVRLCDRTVQEIRCRLTADGLSCDVLVMGGTPSFPCHAVCTHDYLSPGTGILQDKGYRDTFRDLAFHPAAILLTRVISRPGRDLFTCDLGYKAVAADPAGERAEILGMEYARTVIQNEEHWVLRVPEEHCSDIPEIGTLLYCIPTHICPTSALYPSVPVVSGGVVTEWWDVTARNRKITV